MDIGGSGMDCNMGEGGTGSDKSFRGGTTVTGFGGGGGMKLLLPSRSRGIGRGTGWKEFRRPPVALADWPVDLLLLVRGVETVRAAMEGRDGCIARGGLAVAKLGNSVVSTRDMPSWAACSVSIDC